MFSFQQGIKKFKNKIGKGKKRDNEIIKTRLTYDHMCTSMISMLKAVMEKVDNMQCSIGNGVREVKTIRKNKIKILETKYAVTEIRDFFDLISRLDKRKERINDFQHINRNFTNGNIERKKEDKRKEQRSTG